MTTLDLLARVQAMEAYRGGSSGIAPLIESGFLPSRLSTKSQYASLLFTLRACHILAHLVLLDLISLRIFDD
jgi:hypothetical protein